VTEEITGVDLVEWQLRVASGEALPKRQDELSINGWAMEARLYAEDPATGFLPSIGRLDRYCLPDEEIRVDSGVEEMSVVSPFYDPMIAKLIVHGFDRDEAVDALVEALEGTAVWPVKCNAGFLYAAANSQQFRSGDVTTNFIAEQGDALIPLAEPDLEVLGQAGRHLVEAYADKTRYSRDNELLEGFRLNRPRNTTLVLQHQGANHKLTTVPDFGGDTYSSAVGPDAALVTKFGQSFVIGLPRYCGGGHHGSHDGDILSPMPGRIIAVEVAAGQSVTKGQKLLTLEAMKMEHSLTAPFDGVVAELNAVAGAQVQVEALLVRIEVVE
jgi:3-methylcrotonyl-CoA carboxylase alpha subunit